MFTSLIVVIFSFSSIAMARNIPSGHEVANGGYFLQCNDNSPTGPGVFSLDRIEGELRHSLFPASHFNNFSNEEEIVRTVISDLRHSNPLRAAQYDQWYTDILANKTLVNDLAIKPVPDTGTVTIPAGCQLRQAAVFMTEQGSATGRFMYDGDLWNQASPLDRAYLVLHEMIYQEARLPENVHLNSMASRYLTAYLMSKSGTLRDADLVQVLIQTKFRSGQYRGVPLALTIVNSMGQAINTPIQYFKNSIYIQKAVLEDSFNLSIGNLLLARDCKIPLELRSNDKNTVEFHAQGLSSRAVKRLVFQVLPEVPGCGSINGSNSFEFDEQGQLIQVSRVE